jgi:hypothetical protein
MLFKRSHIFFSELTTPRAHDRMQAIVDGSAAAQICLSPHRARGRQQNRQDAKAQRHLGSLGALAVEEQFLRCAPTGAEIAKREPRRKTSAARGIIRLT